MAPTSKMVPESKYELELPGVSFPWPHRQENHPSSIEIPTVLSGEMRGNPHVWRKAAKAHTAASVLTVQKWYASYPGKRRIGM